MILTILGLIAIVIFGRQVYIEAKSTGRNEALWIVIVGVVGIGFQFVLPLLFGIVYVIVRMAAGTAPEDIALGGFGVNFLIATVPLLLSVIAMFFVLKHVSSIPDDAPAVSGPEPPPPPVF